MGSRLELQIELESILGSRNVYFQPPSSVKMQYPAIIYSLSKIDNRYANDAAYTQVRSYTITLIDKNSDSPIVNDLLLLRYCRFDRHYISDNLNHYIFTLYY